MSPASQVVLLLGSEGFASRIFLMFVILYRPNCRTTYENVMLSLLHLITGQYLSALGPYLHWSVHLLLPYLTEIAHFQLNLSAFGLTCPFQIRIDVFYRGRLVS